MHTELEPLCTVAEACDSEKIGKTVIYERINAGDYVAYKFGRSTRLSVASIRAYRDRNKLVPKAPASGQLASADNEITVPKVPVSVSTERGAAHGG